MVEFIIFVTTVELFVLTMLQFIKANVWFIIKDAPDIVTEYIPLSIYPNVIVPPVLLYITLAVLYFHTSSSTYRV